MKANLETIKANGLLLIARFSYTAMIPFDAMLYWFNKLIQSKVKTPDLSNANVLYKHSYLIIYGLVFRVFTCINVEYYVYVSHEILFRSWCYL